MLRRTCHEFCAEVQRRRDKHFVNKTFASLREILFVFKTEQPNPEPFSRKQTGDPMKKLNLLILSLLFFTACQKPTPTPTAARTETADSPTAEEPTQLTGLEEEGGRSPGGSKPVEPQSRLHDRDGLERLQVGQGWAHLGPPASSRRGQGQAGTGPACGPGPQAGVPQGVRGRGGISREEALPSSLQRC